MAKKTTEMNDNGKIVTYRTTKAMRKSEAKLIPWTEGPTTPAKKIARALWG